MSWLSSHLAKRKRIKQALMNVCPGYDCGLSMRDRREILLQISSDLNHSIDVIISRNFDNRIITVDNPKRLDYYLRLPDSDVFVSKHVDKLHGRFTSVIRQVYLHEPRNDKNLVYRSTYYASCLDPTTDMFCDGNWRDNVIQAGLQAMLD